MQAKNQTQFAVAVIGMLGLAIATMVAVSAMVLGFSPDKADLVIGLLVGGLTSVTSTAAAWLFRINGSAK